MQPSALQQPSDDVSAQAPLPVKTELRNAGPEPKRFTVADGQLGEVRALCCWNCALPGFPTAGYTLATFGRSTHSRVNGVRTAGTSIRRFMRHAV